MGVTGATVDGVGVARSEQEGGEGEGGGEEVEERCAADFAGFVSIDDA